MDHLKEVGVWAVKLPSADAIVVRKTLSCLVENPHGLPGVNESTEQVERREAFWSSIKPVDFGMKIASKSVLGVVRYITVGVFIGLFGKTAIGRWLLLKFPSLFSLGWFRKKGPAEDEVASATFKMWFVEHGFSDGSLASQYGDNYKRLNPESLAIFLFLVFNWTSFILFENLLGLLAPVDLRYQELPVYTYNPAIGKTSRRELVTLPPSRTAIVSGSNQSKYLNAAGSSDNSTGRKRGPTEDEVASASFKMWFVGHGFSDGSLASQGNRKPDMEIITRVMGPEIGYMTTPIILVQCALVLLKKRDNLPKGGVFTPGIVFGPTDLQDKKTV
ncbi:hypothetical protein K7X08_019312 [Anisodus acutangulus]|uniref:Uncharacterized protein n=1 Tax=Anisodus acutangulus TaxID=402998 RepID=A0A9Q1RPX1_9SOLA|nr:hypothetical protein K7X08_019312 [Anisodus acutangulus]